MYRNYQPHAFCQGFARAMDNRSADEKATIFPVNLKRRTVSKNKKFMRAILSALIAVSAPAYSASLVAELDPAIMFNFGAYAFNGQRLFINCTANCNGVGVLRADQTLRRASADWLSARNLTVTVTGNVGVGGDRAQTYNVNLTNPFCIVTWTLKKDGSISMRREMC